MTAIERALISVHDKTGLVVLARFLVDHKIEILSTGGTARTLRNAGIAVTDVSAVTGFPEILDGRVKTLHPGVHGGLLAALDKPEHTRALSEHGIAPIGLLVASLYPFESTVAAGADFASSVEQIDVGGPAMIRGAAKNHQHVTVIVDAADYEPLKAEITRGKGRTSDTFRRRLAQVAFARTSAYDAAIASWFAGQIGEPFPRRFTIAGERNEVLRYGENPHQSAALYVGGQWRFGVATAKQIQGKELSFNNLADADAAFELVSEFDRPAVVIVKHNNPSGAAVAPTVAEAYAKALACDPVSAFGSIVAANRPVDAAAAEAIAKLFAEVVVAPDIQPGAAKIFATKKNLRVLATGGLADQNHGDPIIRSMAGGFLVQSRDSQTAGELKVVTKRQPTPAEIADLRFAFTVCKHVKSNAVVFAKGETTVGIGAGQMSRVDSSHIAAHKAAAAARAAGEATPRTKGSAAASEAFFPFADGLIACADAGATAIIQPGGSVRDHEVIAAADERGLAMVFTGIRHFRH